MVPQNKILFLDTNILSDIGRLNDGDISAIVMQICVEHKMVVALTIFNIVEIENIPDVTLRSRIHEFIYFINVAHFKAMDKLFIEEAKNYTNHYEIEPIMFTTTFISKVNGKPSNYKAVLDNLRGSIDFQSSVKDHERTITTCQSKFSNKLSVSLDDFIVFYANNTHLFPESRQLMNIKDLGKYCPSFVSYCCSLYDKIGSKGLRKKAGELNDNAMSYIFPYVGVLVTEKRQANMYNEVKNMGLIPAMKDTLILKHSDVFKLKDGILRFSLIEALQKS